MATYVVLSRYAGHGIQSIKDSPSRLDADRQAMRPLGVEIKAFYLTMGQYDSVVIFEAPDDEAMAKALLALASQGNVRTETMRAFSENEFRQIVGSLP